jgi:hypothetical protein
MKALNLKHVFICGAALIVMILFSACAGVGGTNGSTTLTGSIVSASGTTVVINVNGQQDTITNVPATIVQQLSSQVGKVYTINVNASGNGSFSFTTGSSVTQDTNDGTPEVGDTPTTNETPTTVEQGSIEFFGNIIASSSSSVTVSMPDGSQLSMTLNGTDLGDFNNSLPAIGTHVKVTANTNQDGSFNASKISTVDSSDATNQVTFQGVTTAAVGSDNVIHFTVGNKPYSFTVSSGADLSDFNNSAQQIQSGTSVKVEVQYNSATNVTVLKVSNNNS